ncbi:hypothetical protein SLEP1_g38810 [Rubroshorea leprosula]|uniref:Uncharacterized protein n=1 Tax=Rubroshorea leprosula TaxID=152421 RepID=A0AAV5KZA5_9ROSI|nr:hypothetical protein SLEP1_g38810 [Rubroshorea leprosula]
MVKVTNLIVWLCRKQSREVWLSSRSVLCPKAANIKAVALCYAVAITIAF